MLWVSLVLVCTAVVTSSYPTDSPISESPNIAVDSPEDLDNIDTFDISDNLIQDEDCESAEDSSLPIKKSVGQDQPSPVRRRVCSNRNFVRLGRGNSLDVARDLDSEEDIFSRLERARDKFIRFGRGGRNNDNFIRFGRGGKQDNFVRFGRDRSDNFIRFGRGKTDNFIRFGRGKPDNFIRFGRGKSNSFLRLGRAKPDNFIRFGRGKSDNFIRFGRGSNFVRFGRDETTGFDDTRIQPEEESGSNTNFRYGRGGKSDNFIRFGRAGSSNFIRLGRGGDEVATREGRSRNNGNFVRFGRSGSNSELRRGKLTDRNFIRLGRSGQQETQFEYEQNRDDNEDSTLNTLRLGRSENPGNGRNFVRLGKRAIDDQMSDGLSFLRFGRDVEQIEELPILSSGDSDQSDGGNKTTTDDSSHTRRRRSVSYSEEEPPEDSSDYPTIISNNAYDDDKLQSTMDGTQTPFGYYSPLASGIPNYILGPELSVLAPLNNGAESSLSKRAKGDGHNRNYIRLG